jgi:hypothetical protein
VVIRSIYLKNIGTSKSADTINISHIAPLLGYP